MSNSLDVLMRIKLERTDVLNFLTKLFSGYKGYFSKLDDMGISTSDDYGFPHDINISDKNFGKIKISQIPQNYQIYIHMTNQGCININNNRENKKVCILEFGIANQGYFNNELYKEFLFLIKRILKFVDCDYLVIGQNMVYAPDFDYYGGPLFFMGANQVDAIYQGLIRLLKNAINRDYSVKEIKAELRKASITIEKISRNFYFLDTVKFSTKFRLTGEIDVFTNQYKKRKVVVAESKLKNLFKEK